MKTLRLLLGVCALALWAQPALAQSTIETRTAFFAEAYRFDPGLSFNKIRQYTVPIGLTLPFGDKGHVALSTGYTAVELYSADVSQLRNQWLSGIMDTEARVAWNALPGRLTLLLTGTIPTGITGVQTQELTALAALTSDVIGFTAPSLGAGGGVGLGFAAAMPVGSWALGLGGTFRKSFRYEYVASDPNRLTPGSEMRLRAGIEGRLGRKTYLRVASVLAHRLKDQVGSTTRHGIGVRLVGYLAVSHGVANTSLQVYAFDVYRSKPQIETTAVGAGFLPRGNLIGVGASWTVPAWKFGVTPRAEFRYSAQAPLAFDPVTDLPMTSGPVERAGESFRLGITARYPLMQGVAVVAQGSWVTGSVVQDGDVGFYGTRGALHLEWRP
jgi:hypothetical protein